MTQARDPMRTRVRLRKAVVLSDEGAMECLRSVHVGRVLSVRHDAPTLDVMTYVLRGRIMFFHVPRTSLLCRTNVGVSVVVEVDTVDDRNGDGWAVEAHGTASPSHVNVPYEVNRALIDEGSAATASDRLVRVQLTSVRGRRYV